MTQPAELWSSSGDMKSQYPSELAEFVFILHIEVRADFTMFRVFSWFVSMNLEKYWLLLEKIKVQTIKINPKLKRKIKTFKMN